MKTNPCLEMDEFCYNLPKIELHAHLNGSISQSTLEDLLTAKLKTVEEDSEFSQTYASNKLMIERDDQRTLQECFSIFKVIQQLTDTEAAIYRVAKDVIKEFSEENVKYLELRSTPRAVPSTGLTRASYVESILRAIEDSKSDCPDIIVRFLLSIDLRNGVEVAKETIALAAKYKESTNGVVVGIDLSGDPDIGEDHRREYLPVLKEAKNQGLKLALHLAELPGLPDTMDMLRLPPDRIGHGTFLHPDVGGSNEMIDYVRHLGIPIELCLTSNVKCSSVKDFKSHHFQFWHAGGHPCIICTDDKGVFSTSLKAEYAIAASTFDLTKQALWDLSYKSIDSIFAEESVKQRLQQTWNDIKPSMDM